MPEASAALQLVSPACNVSKWPMFLLSTLCSDAPLPGVVSRVGVCPQLSTHRRISIDVNDP